MKSISEENVSIRSSQLERPSAVAISISGLLVYIIPAISLLAAIGAMLLGLLSIPRMDLGTYVVPTLAGLCVVLQLLFFDAFLRYKVVDFRVILLAVLAFGFLFVYRLIPEYVTGFQLNGIFHRSLFAAGFLLLVGTPSACLALFYLLKATPSAADISIYPLILLPVIIILGLYLTMVVKLVTLGLATFNLEILTQPFVFHSIPIKEYIAGDWPSWKTEILKQSGMLNHLLGTALLILMTSLISLPIGIGAGVYLSEYSENKYSGFARTAIGSLRAISLLILALFAYSLATLSRDTPLGFLFAGTYSTGYGEAITNGGSFLTASLVLSLLVIPIITRSTEEGCRSVPSDLREGSYALGATEGRTMRRIVMPWAVPNIVTGWLLGCAEAAGSVAILIFIAFTGEYGVGPFRQVTSLAYYIFNANFDDPGRAGMMKPYQFMAAFLLLTITLGLGLIAMVAKRVLSRRYRGT